MGKPEPASDLQFQNCAIRTIEKNGELWWVAKDVCNLFNDSNHKRSLSRLDDDEKGVSHIMP